MKVLFVIYQLDFADHIALAYLSAIAKERGHSTHLCVLRNSSLSEMVDGLKPDVVAYSTNIVGHDEIVAAHKSAQSRHAYVSIMGGPHVTMYPETFSDAGVDAYCIGEGEWAFRDFLQCLESGQPFDGIPNLVTTKAGNPVRPLIGDLDEIPFPDRDLVLANSYLKSTPKKTFYTTRGCPFSCKYCANNYYRRLYQGKGKYVRRFSVERVIREMEHVASRYRTDFVKIGDDLFALRTDEWLREFAEAYAQRVAVPFNCYLRLDSVDEHLLSLLKQAGCYSVHLSVDSTSEYVREEVLGRRMRNVDIVRQLRMIRRFGINTWVNFMLAAPGSTLLDDLSTIGVGKKGKATYLSYSTTVPIRGTELYDYCVRNAMIDVASHRNDMNGCSQRTALNIFPEKEKDIRYNIYLVGAIIAKLPFPFDRMAIAMIKRMPPNRLFVGLRNVFYRYNIENRIFRLGANAA